MCLLSASTKLHYRREGRAVANSTSATFLRVVGSELTQKYLGEGPKLVRELFRVADDLSPSIVFIDEIDAVGTKSISSDELCSNSRTAVILDFEQGLSHH
ncbi:hypothetical protein IFM89_035002 [Coptis chinensis]|uniref:ATPase AAA-type core domain-containing protein n=1 Tax=Coptis chinensis TaxID=261450 RepID=A0A835IUG6_9MAGN|nr:hypothetical protein IFM89_035002 [Coptis chinensis]